MGPARVGSMSIGPAGPRPAVMARMARMATGRAFIARVATGLRAPALTLALAARGREAAGEGRAQDAALFPVERGDVLSVTVLNEPSLSREVKVDALGRIMLPQIGSVSILGRDLDEIRAAIEASLSARHILRDPQVVVEVSAYRPFYVGGSVARQGAIAYEPGLTVRHALLLAGGVRRQGGAKELSALDLLAMRADWRANTFALLEVESRIARLQAELEDRRAVTPPEVADKAIPQADAAAILSLDSALLADQLDIRSAHARHMADLMRVTNVELDVLAKQTAHQQLESALQEQEVENAQTLVEKGLTSQVRVRELERERSQIARSVLEVQAYTARAQQNKETISYELQTADRKWRMDTRAALRDAVLERTGLQAKAELLTAKLLEAGITLSDGDRAAPPVPKVTIHRRLAGREQALAAGMETEIMPGDILDVALALDPQG